MVHFGEIGLSGKVRQVTVTDARPANLGFEAGTLPTWPVPGQPSPVQPHGLVLREIGHIFDLVAGFSPDQQFRQPTFPWRGTYCGR
jgi:DNA repair protein RadA/Sms